MRSARPRSDDVGERGQGSVEWVGLVLVVALLLGGAATVGRSLVPEGAQRPPDEVLAARWAPRLVLERGTVGVPVDPRRCRAVACSVGARPVLFSHVVRRGATTYVQYWAYWPDSSWHGIAGRHADDWESFQVRVDPDGTAWARASAHHGYTGERVGPDLNVNQVRPSLVPERWRRAWTPWAGGYRVAKDTHAGFVTGTGGVPVTVLALDPATMPQDYAVSPPWRKRVYANPESAAT